MDLEGAIHFVKLASLSSDQLSIQYHHAANTREPRTHARVERLIEENEKNEKYFLHKAAKVAGLIGKVVSLITHSQNTYSYY